MSPLKFCETLVEGLLSCHTAVVNNFMAAGGDNYRILIDGRNQVVGRTDLDVFYDYILKTFNRGSIVSPIVGRITNIPVTVPTP